MNKPGIRWIQRFNNFTKAFSRLEEAVALAEERQLSELEEQGLIQAFEFTHELAWNTLKDFLEGRGAGTLFGSKDTTRAAFKAGIIENGDVWMAMVKSRNLTSHTYDEAVATSITAAVRDLYFAEFEALKIRLERMCQEERS
jgi:nucleotidyltransferase substrate binding protein (TIGR01987 family)